MQFGFARIAVTLIHWLLLAMAFASIPAMANESSLELTDTERQWLREHPVIRLGVDQYFAPYSMLDGQGHFVGAAADFANLLSRQLGVKFKVVAPAQWPDVLKGARRRQIDMIATASQTKEREEYLAFTGVYLKTPLVIMARSNDTSLRNAADLNYRSVAMVRDYYSSERVLKDYPEAQALFVHTPLEGLIAVATGQADAYVGAIGVNLSIATHNGISNLRVAAPYDLDNGQHYGVRSDWPLFVGILEKALAAIPEVEKERIYRRWVPQDIPREVQGKPVLTAAEQKWIADHPAIRVGLLSGNEPVEYVDEHGLASGFLPKYLALLSKKTGLNIEIVWRKDRVALLGDLHAGVLDAVSLRSLPQTNGDAFLLSAPFHHSLLGVFIEKKIPFFGGIAELKGGHVSLAESGAALPVVRRYPDIFPVVTDSPRTALEAALDGRADASILDVESGTYLIEKYGYKKLHTGYALPGETTSLRFAIRADWPDLASVINRAIASVSDDEITTIRRASFSTNARGGVPREMVVFWGQVTVAGVLSLFLLSAYFVNRRLRGEVAQRHQSDAAAQSSEQRFSLTFEYAAVGMALVAPDGGWLKVNRRLCEMLDYSEDELTRKRLDEITFPEDRELDANEMAALLAAEIDSYSVEKRYLRKGGELAVGHLTITLVNDADGAPDYFIAVVEDITERKQSEARIEFLAYRDALTGLPNRILLADRVSQAMAEAQRAGKRLALLFVDMDNFKVVNDTHGHIVGDKLLVLVAERLKSGMRACDTVGRLGGDEFLLLITDIAADEPVQVITRVVEKVFEQLKAPFVVEEHELSVLASVGIAVYPDDGDSFDTLLREADTAMYAAKADGRNTYHFFVEQMNVEAVSYDQMRNGLRYALERGELHLHYQPQTNLNTGKLIGFEALLRWSHPQLGNVSPARFIPVAEDSGLIVGIGAWVLAEACRQAVVWRNAGYENLTMAVNLSAVQFKRDNLEQTVVNVLATSGLAPEFLELELTESILIQSAESVLDIVQKLKALGVRLSIDDFGTGYSSLSYLKRFPVDKLKIDQSFVRDMLQNPGDEAIVQSIISLASNLHLTTIAEGIETAEQRDMLRRLGCQECQGYLVARPMSAADCTAYLATREIQPSDA